MPLVVPNLSEDDKAAWAAKLMGKKITESESNETVSLSPLMHAGYSGTDIAFLPCFLVFCKEGPSRGTPSSQAR